MWIRFAAAATVAAVAIALGSLLIPFLLIFHPEGFCAVTRLWCFLPVLWGVWAMLTPRAWMPGRLPHWGAVLGLLLGVVGGLVLNIPERAFYLHLPIQARAGGVLLVGGFYYLLWLLVRKAYLVMTQPPPPASL
jgi:hypothetical protein